MSRLLALPWLALLLLPDASVNVIAQPVPVPKEFARSAFCESGSISGERDDQRHYYPQPPPSYTLPFVWDAVYDPERGRVEITALSRTGAAFNQTHWQHLVHRYPEYASQLSYGDPAKILMSVKIAGHTYPDALDWHNYNYATFDHDALKLNEANLQCVFYDNKHPPNLPGTTFTAFDPSYIKTAATFPDLVYVEMARISTIPIYCPVPLQVQRDWQTGLANNGSRRSRYTHMAIARTIEHDVVVATEPFRVCRGDPADALASPRPRKRRRKRQQQQQQQQQRQQRQRYRHRLAVCTATQRSSRAHLVEWIEYHLLLGVDHFFIYSTGTQKQGAALRERLRDYVAEGIVTLVPWHFKNAVEGMASGSGVWWADATLTTTDYQFFRPPRAIAQTAALASCYSRFRMHARLIAHLDDDEFFFVKPSDDDAAPLVDPTVLTRFFRNASVGAVRFSNLVAFPCNGSEYRDYVVARGGAGEASHQHAPRVGLFHNGFLTQAVGYHNTKLIMRTDSVASFFVHDVTFMESGEKGETVTLSVDRGLLMHYKDRNSGVIWNSRIPLVDGTLNSVQHNVCTKIAHHAALLRRGKKAGLEKHILAPEIRNSTHLYTDLHAPLFRLLQVKFNGRMRKDVLKGRL